MNQRSGTKTMTKAGRPTFKIVPERLRELRERTGLTQKELAERTFGPPKGDEPRSRAIYQQRVECTGRTSKRSAMALANELAQLLTEDPEKTFAFLCGGQPEAPPDRIQEIESRLREQFRSGGNTALILALQQSRQSDQPDEDDICIEELARRIAFQLETVQLEQRSEELAKLAELTGWTVDELLRPNSLHGHWLLNTSTLVLRETATRESEILLGVSDVLRHIEKHGTEWLSKRNESDACVELREDAPWFRVTLTSPNWPVRQEFSFVRCAPSATGLQWVKPSEWDRSKLHGDEWRGSELVDWAFQHANFVKGFKAEEQWPGDLGRLRFQVQQRIKPENWATAEDKDWWQSSAVHKGCLDEDPEYEADLRAIRREAGTEHACVTNWLEQGAWDDVLVPLLSPVPADWWEIEAWGSGIRVRTKNLLPIREMPRYGVDEMGRTYVIQLVEETDSDELRRAPWRLKDVQALAERLQNNLKACQEQVAIGPQRPRWITAA